jgi:predicted aspartyl protease
MGSPTPATAAEPSPYVSYDWSVFLPYINRPAGDADITASPRLRISLGGASHEAILDTGSTGIVISASDIPSVESLPATPGQLAYSSSGRIMVGKWVTTPVTVEGDSGSRFTTRPIPVLAVDRIDCRPKARNCQPEEAPKGVAMLGIGFGREHDGQEQSTPDKNPFLADSAGGEQQRHGYIVTRTGVRIGLTAGDVGPDFAFVKLAPNTKYAGDWTAAPVCITLEDTLPAACGASLVDTGVTGMYITLPAELVAEKATANGKGEQTLADGTHLAFAFPGLRPDKPVESAGYTFSVGSNDNPLAPSFLILNTVRPQPFVNTSVHFLNGFDFLYDADGGMVGYRWTGRTKFGEARPGSAVRD